MRPALAAALLALPAAAAAQDRPAPIEEVASDLAFGYCPLFLAGQFALDAPELAQRGFGTTVYRQPHPRIGEMSIVYAIRDDGELAFGGAAGHSCTVVIAGPMRDSVLAALRERKDWRGLDFQPAENPGPAVAGLSVETFRAPVDGQMLYLQLIRTETPAPAVTAQLFAMES